MSQPDLFDIPRRSAGFQRDEVSVSILDSINRAISHIYESSGIPRRFSFSINGEGLPLQQTTSFTDQRRNLND